MDKWGTSPWGRNKWGIGEWGLGSCLPFYVKPTAGQTLTLTLNLPSGKEMIIDWSYGSTTTVTGPVIGQDFSRTYNNAGTYSVKFYGDYDALTKLDVTAGSPTIQGDVAGYAPLTGLLHMYASGTNELRGDIKRLPRSLTYIHLFGNNTVSGDIADLPPSIEDVAIIGHNTLGGDLGDLPSTVTYFRLEESTTAVTGDIGDLPAGLTFLRLYNLSNGSFTGALANLPPNIESLRISAPNTVTGTLADLPSTMTYFAIFYSNTISGDVADLPSGITYFNCQGDNTVSDYSGKTWTTKPGTFTLVPASGGLSTSEVDQLLIDFDADLTWASGDTITLTGTNAARSSASDAAVNNMVAEGATVTTN